MDAIKFIKERERMCEKSRECSMCPIGEALKPSCEEGYRCDLYECEHPEDYVKIVEKWSKEHPQKTILDDFKEKYPNAKYGEDGYPKSCPDFLGYKVKCNRGCLYLNRDECHKLWDAPLEEATK